MWRSSVGAMCVLVACLMACKKGDDDDKSESSDESSESSEGSEEDKPKAPSGLKAKSNDPKVLALAKQALSCTWEGSYFKHDCEAHKTWRESELLKKGKADATLVNLLEDEDVKVRWLAVKSLRLRGDTFKTDKQLAERIIEVAEAEKSETICEYLGNVVGEIDTEKTGLKAEVEKLLAGHSVQQFRVGLADDVLDANPGFFDVMLTLAAKEKDAKVRYEAVDAFWGSSPPGRNEEVCAMWLDRVRNDSEEKIMAAAAYHGLTSSRNCAAAWDKILDVIEARAKAGTAKAGRWGSALGGLHDRDSATDAQKKRALALARTLCDNKQNSGIARSNALDVIGRRDPGAKAYAAKFKTDDEFFVKNSVQRILKKK